MPDQPLPAFARAPVPVVVPEAPRTPEDSREWAWGGADGAGVRVAVVDSGIEADHPALEGCVDAAAGVSVIANPDGGVDVVPGPHEDSFGHGTACAAIIHGLAPKARITSVKVLGAQLSASSAVFLNGLGWAIEQRFDVINLSLGTTKRDWALAFYELCDSAYFSGSLLVTAANNVPVASYPSLYANVISVACNLSTDPLDYDYNPDPPTEFLAPGIGLTLAWKGHSQLIGSGNSYAAPHISGFAALIRSKHPDLRTFQVKAMLAEGASNVVERRPPRPAAIGHRSPRRSARAHAAAGRHATREGA